MKSRVNYMPKSNFLYIDWISSEYHNSFNDAFFNALKTKNNEVIFFNSKCELKNQKVSYINDLNNSRVARLFSVIKLVKKSNKPIFFLSYDWLLIIPLLFFKRNFYAFEHNTVPYRNEKLKLLLQKIFLKKLIRLTQFPQQTTRLHEINQKTHFIGSPLQSYKNEKNLNSKEYILIPSDRISKECLKLINICSKKCNLLIRSSALSNAQIDPNQLDSSISIVDWFDIQNNHSNIKSILIATDDNIRGSGWFNESISRGIPILFFEKNMSEIFKKTFPNYKYHLIQSIEEFDIAINDLESLNKTESMLTVENFNNDFRDRFNSIFSL